MRDPRRARLASLVTPYPFGYDSLPSLFSHSRYYDRVFVWGG